MSIVSRVYSLIALTKAGHTGGKDSGFVQRLKGAVAITFVKAAGLAQLMANDHFKKSTSRVLLETHRSTLRNKHKEKPRHETFLK